MGLVLDEYKAQQQSKMKTSKQEQLLMSSAHQDAIGYHDSDEEEYETESEGEDPYPFYGGDFDESDGDEEYKDDPVYLTDLTDAIKSWIIGLNQTRPSDLVEIARMISSKHQAILREF